MLSGFFARNVATRREHTATTAGNMASSLSTGQQQQHTQGLPSITSLTNGLPKPAPISPDGQSLTDPVSRDSGTWPQPQSKRKLTTLTSKPHGQLPYENLTHLLPSADTFLRGGVSSYQRARGCGHETVVSAPWLPHTLHRTSYVLMHQN